MRVRVYWNATRKGWSVMTKVEGRWRVTDYRLSLTLADATFYVSDKGRERVRDWGKKIVHAWIEGDLMDNVVQPHPFKYPEIVYNPFCHQRFKVRWEPVEVHDAPIVYLNNNGLIPRARKAMVSAPIINQKG